MESAQRVPKKLDYDRTGTSPLFSSSAYMGSATQIRPTKPYNEPITPLLGGREFRYDYPERDQDQGLFTKRSSHNIPSPEKSKQISQMSDLDYAKAIESDELYRRLKINDSMTLWAEAMQRFKSGFPLSSSNLL
jgi:hypothetical protein